MFLSINEDLGLEPMLQSFSLWASVGKVKAISEGFDHPLFA